MREQISKERPACKKDYRKDDLHLEKFEPGKAQKFYRYHIKLLKQVEIPKEMPDRKDHLQSLQRRTKEAVFEIKDKSKCFGTSEAKKRIIKG